MNHDEQWLGQLEGVLIGGVDDKEHAAMLAKTIRTACMEYGELMAVNINNEHDEIINAADTLAKKALDYGDATKAVRYGDVVEAAREYWRVRGE